MTVSKPFIFRKWMHSDEDLELFKKLGKEPIRAIMNDGSVPIQGTDEEGELIAIAYVLPTTKVKRGSGHIHEDADRDAMAQRIVDALNRG
jgi:hypothetical protein